MNAKNMAQHLDSMDKVQMPQLATQIEEKQTSAGDGGAKTAIALLILALVAGIIYAIYKSPSDYLAFYQRLYHSPWAAFSKGLGILGTFVLVWRIVLVLTYRPAASCSDDQLYNCTVVIPAYNEGSQVLATLRSVMASDYPAEKMQVICVDDGSKDDTWSWMQRGAEEFGDRVELVRQPMNKGKRHALYEGFTRATGEILVTIDSDSEIEVQTLRRMVSVFCRNGKVGAVAGNVRVLNRHEGFIPKMMDVAFAYSFDFIRASQSRINTVICTPGALSAYARRAVMPVLDEWVAQTFMGRPANIGEDRAMTNFVLRQGLLVHYQSDAVVFTNVPTTYVCLCKMMLRWARSNVRETIAMARFAFTKFRSEPVSGARLNLVMSLLSMTVGEVAKFALLGMVIAWPMLAGTKLLVGALLASLLPGGFYLLRHRSSDFLWAFPYTLYWLAALSWISIYALCTPQRNGWLTRQLASSGETREPEVSVVSAVSAVSAIEALHAATMPLCAPAGAASLWNTSEVVAPCQSVMTMDRFQIMAEPRIK